MIGRLLGNSNHPNITSKQKSFQTQTHCFQYIQQLILGKPVSTPQGLSQLRTRIILKQPLTPPERKSIVAYRTSNHKLAIETDQWLNNPTPKINKLCHFCSCNVVQKGSTLVLECPPKTSFMDRFPSLIQNVAIGSLKWPPFLYGISFLTPS